MFLKPFGHLFRKPLQHLVRVARWLKRSAAKRWGGSRPNSAKQPRSIFGQIRPKKSFIQPDFGQILCSNIFSFLQLNKIIIFWLKFFKTSYFVSHFVASLTFWILVWVLLFHTLKLHNIYIKLCTLKFALKRNYNFNERRWGTNAIKLCLNDFKFCWQELFWYYVCILCKN